MDLTLPSSVRHLAACGGGSNSVACGDDITSSLRAGLLREPARVPSRGGALGVALQAASSSGGRGMRGFTGFFLGGVWPSEELVGGAFGCGQEQSAGGWLVLVGAGVVGWMCQSWCLAVRLG
jgi:hypothetical protein